MLSYDPKLDAYAILGVDPEASQKEVEAAFRRAALTWHPDKSPAPDAADRFHEVEKAGNVLRDPEQRRAYDRLRRIRLGHRAERRSRPRRPPEPYVPMRPPPAWLAERVKVHYDSVLITFPVPRRAPWTARLFNALACVALGGALATGEMIVGALAVVLWAIGRVLLTPPHEGLLAWAKIIPGRKRAEYHALDQRRHRYDRLDVPFQRLTIAVVAAVNQYRVEIHGFPRAAKPVLYRTPSLDEARKCAREVGQWLQLPLQRAA
ncbi:MAG: J domain-containing protein [Planctomycetota bacterium]|jgi:hypothetical protein